MWIDEKASHLDADKLKGEVTSFDDKVRKLQKHQAFMAELQAHECSIKEVTDKGKETQEQKSLWIQFQCFVRSCGKCDSSHGVSCMHCFSLLNHLKLSVHS